jgi:hypothetical protein
MFEDLERFLAEAWTKVRGVLLVLAVSGWSILWLLVLGFGWLFSIEALIGVSIGMLGLTGGGVVTMQALGRRARRRLARRSLVARADLERLRLAPELRATLESFDVSHKNVRGLLEDPAIDGASLRPTLAENVSAARERLYQITREENELRADLARLQRVQSTGAVGATIEETRARIQRLQREAEQIAVDMQKLSSRLGEVRALANDTDRTAPEQAALEKAIEDADRIAAAYREIQSTQLLERGTR